MSKRLSNNYRQNGCSTRPTQKEKIEKKVDHYLAIEYNMISRCLELHIERLLAAFLIKSLLTTFIQVKALDVQATVSCNKYGQTSESTEVCIKFA